MSDMLFNFFAGGCIGVVLLDSVRGDLSKAQRVYRLLIATAAISALFARMAQ